MSSYAARVSLWEVRDAVEAAARATATLPAGDWVQWLSYFLEALDGYVPESEFRRVLEDACRCIEDRLREGRW